MTRVIPILRPDAAITDIYIHRLDLAIRSDGCTGVKDYYRECCVVHDLAYRFHIDPWGQPVNRRAADANFRRCIQSRSKLGRWSPFSWVRWLGVRSIGWAFYPEHVTTTFEEEV